jgi:deoxyadenosine/deoxycytidine kinase
MDMRPVDSYSSSAVDRTKSTDAERPRYIAVDGPIGVGKTALAEILARRLGARLVSEPADNPFLAGFYQDPRRYAFQAQLFYLLSRYHQQGELLQEDLFSTGGVVTDYLFQRDRVFAQLNLSESELALYDKVYRLLHAAAPRPDLVVYLTARPEVLQERVARRGAGRTLPAAYISEVARSYAEFFFHWQECPLLVVNTSEIDFVESPADQDDLVAVIRRTRAGTSHYNPLGSR